MKHYFSFSEKSLVLGLTILLCATSVWAATPDERDTAGAAQARFDAEQEFRKRVLKMRIEERGKPEIEAPEEAEALKEGVAFKLKNVVLTGNDSIPTESFDPIIAKYIGKEVYLNDLRELAIAIKREYRERGYIAAYVYLPPQSVTDNTVEIAVIEGKLGSVEVTGNKWFSGKVIKRFLRLAPGQVLFYNDLRRALSFLNKHRDVQGKAILKPGKEAKTTDLEISVKDKFPIHIGADVNNIGTQNTGKTRVGFSLSDTNLFGQMDQLSSRFQLGSRTWSVGADYNIPVHSSGTLVGISYTRSHVNVGGAFDNLGIKGNATTYGVYAIQPVLSRSWVDASMNLGFDWKSVKNTMLGEESGHDELRILNTGVNPEFSDAWGKTFFPNTFSVGLPGFLGASHKNNPSATRPGTGGQFFIYRSSLIRYQRLPADMMYVFRGQMQLTNDALPPSEQLSLGGALAVRGYPEGEYLADYGAYMTNELYVPTYFFPKDWKLPYSTEPVRKQIQAVGFFDFGGGNLRKPLAGEKNNRTLAGTGIGMRIRMFDKVYGRIQWAMPTGSRSQVTGSETAFYYGISAEAF
jgi:hemolysin activation/secretion protein